MFAAAARCYIEKLIRLQNIIEEKGYRRTDQAAVKQARVKLKNQLSFYEYKTDEQMHRFWEAHQNEIRTLIPADTHPAFRKLMNEFIELKNH